MVASDTAWHSSQEFLLKDLAQRCISRSVLHRIEYAHYYRFNSAITIPTIVISLLAGAASAAQSTLIEILGESAESHVPLVIGMLSMLISILNSVSSFLKIPALTEQNLQSHLQFEKLSRQIQSEICVRNIDRKMSGREACQKFEGAFQQLLDLSPPVSSKTERKFTNRRDVKMLHVPVPHTIKMTKLRTYTEMERDRKQQEEQEKADALHKLNRPKPRSRFKWQWHHEDTKSSPASTHTSDVETQTDTQTHEMYTDKLPSHPLSLTSQTQMHTQPVLDEISHISSLGRVRAFTEGKLIQDEQTATETDDEEWLSAASGDKDCDCKTDH